MLDRVRAGDGGGGLGGSPGVSSCVTATMVLRQVAKRGFWKKDKWVTSMGILQRL